MRVVAFGLAPAYSSIETRSASPCMAAQWSAVMPSPWAAFTSAASLSSVRTAAVSPRMAASATGESPGAARSSVERQSAPIALRPKPVKSLRRMSSAP